MTFALLPCPACADGFTTTGDRHARTKMDVCRVCAGTGRVNTRTGEVRAASCNPVTGRPFGEPVPASPAAGPADA